VTEHEQMQELLAGYALRSLSGIDAKLADAVLTEHVPTCEDCRRTLDAFGVVVGDLALAPEPVEPPELLLTRIHRDLEPDGNRARRLGTGWIAAIAAGFVFVVALGSLALTGGGGPSATFTDADIHAALAMADQPGVETKDLGQVDQVTPPDPSSFYLVGQDVPQPPAGEVYRLWLRTGDQETYVGQFLPDGSGTVAIHVTVDGGYDEVIVTTEDPAASPTPPA